MDGAEDPDCSLSRFTPVCYLSGDIEHYEDDPGGEMECEISATVRAETYQLTDNGARLQRIERDLGAQPPGPPGARPQARARAKGHLQRSVQRQCCVDLYSQGGTYIIVHPSRASFEHARPSREATRVRSCARKNSESNSDGWLRNPFQALAF